MFDGEQPGDGSRADARNAELVGLLAEKVDDDQVALEWMPALTEAPDRLDCAEHSDDPVEPPTTVHGVGVGSGHQHRQLAVTARTAPDDVSRGVAVNVHSR
jgi:hypothetical protein